MVDNTTYIRQRNHRTDETIDVFRKNFQYETGCIRSF